MTKMRLLFQCSALLYAYMEAKETGDMEDFLGLIRCLPEDEGPEIRALFGEIFSQLQTRSQAQG